MLTRKIVPFAFALLFIGHIARAQEGMATTIKTQALDMARAILAKDLDKVVEYFPPKLVEASGGKAKVLTVRDSMNKFMQQFGAEIKKVIVGNPGKIISYKGQLQTTLPQTTQVAFMQNTVVLETTLVAVSEDKGQHWYFIDANMYRSPKLKASLPELSPELMIPPQKKPEINLNQ